MNRTFLPVSLLAVFSVGALLEAQVTLNPSPARIVGHAQLALKSASPNLVEGRELWAPQALAVDTSATPPILYVSDTLNNRVLAWRDASQFGAGAMADIVIGQKDKFSTFPQGPFSGAQLTGGLNTPTGLAVDPSGNLFVADSGNNRILRFPAPFSQPDAVKLPDLVLGQSSFSTNKANEGGRSAHSLFLSVNVSGRLVPADLLFSGADLYCSDPGNGRVLRYPAALIGPGAASGPDADLVLGQQDFIMNPQNPSSAADLSRLYYPAGLGMDPAGRLYVTDARHRVVVYEPPFFNGGGARRRIGDGTAPQPPTVQTLNTPEGVVLAGDIPLVMDTANNRILRYDRYEDWPTDLNIPPLAKGVIGQPDFIGYQPNQGSAQSSAGSLFQPPRAVFAEGELYVADSLNHRVLVFPDPTAGSSQSAVRLFGQKSFELNGANLVEGREFYFSQAGAGIAVDRNSDPPHLYVADTLNNRVLGFRDARNLRPGDSADLVIGQPGPETIIANYPAGDVNQPSANGLYQPTGVVVDAAGNLYVADSGNGRVLRFAVPFQSGVNQPDADLVLGKPNFTASQQSGPDPSPSNMGSPFGLAFTGEGHLLVSDFAFNRVLLLVKPTGGDFTSGMAAYNVFGQPDFFSRDRSTSGSPEPNRMYQPRHIATDSDDRLYVCDTENSRVQIFDRAPAAGTDPSPVFSLGGTSKPQGILVSPATGEIWVGSTGNARLLRFPKFSSLILNANPEVTLTTGATTERPLAVTLDSFGNLLAAFSTNRVAQYFPAMTPVNSANYLARMAPGMIASLYPLDQGDHRFGEVTEAFSNLPLPTELGGLQVLIENQPAPLFFVSPEQINFVMPQNLPESGSVELQVVRPSTGQVLAVGCSAVKSGKKPNGTDLFRCTGPVAMDRASPALFAGVAGSHYDLGTGHAAALNEDNTINSPANPISRGKVIQLFGTGQGIVPGAPPDGEAPTGPVPTPDRPQVIVGTDFVDDADIQYSGLAPYLVGVWQLNVRIPERVAPANEVLIVILHKGIPSNNPQVPTQIQTTIAVKQ